jgi:hypothetical protein
MSVSCQEETHAPQQSTSLFDLLIGDGDERLRYREAEISPQYSIGTARRWAHGQQSHLSHCTIVPNQFVSNRAWDRFALAGNLTDTPEPENKQIREGPMTTAGQAFLSIGGLFCLSFAAIALVYFADRLRSGFLGKP